MERDEEAVHSKSASGSNWTVVRLAGVGGDVERVADL